MSISTSYAVRDDEGAFLSRATVESRESRLCLTLIEIWALVFLICVPYVRMSAQASPAFVTVYNSVWHKLLNLWPLVVMGYWFYDVTLSSYLNSGRYDLGFYAGRIYGVLAASFVLAALVLENSRLYRRLAIAASRLKERATEPLRANETLRSEIAYRKRVDEGLRQARAELARVSRMAAMGELSSSLAHEVNHPIGAIMMNAETCLRRLPHQVPNVERARTIASMIVKGRNACLRDRRPYARALL